MGALVKETGNLRVCLSLFWDYYCHDETAGPKPTSKQNAYFSWACTS